MVETPVTRPLRVFAYAMLSVAFMASMNVFVKLASESHAIVEIMFFRNAIGIIPVVMLILLQPKGLALFKPVNPWGHVLRGCVGTCSMVFFFWSFRLLPLADATAIQFAMPTISTVLSVWILHERVGPWRWAGVILGFMGILIIAAPTGDTSIFGSAVALMAALSASFTMMIVRKIGKTEHALTIVFYFSVIGTLISAAFLPWFWTPPSLKTFFYLIMCGILGGAAQVFLTKSYAEAPAAYVAPFNYISILFAVFFGWAIWSEVPTMQTLIGAGVVIASGLLILYREVLHKQKPIAAPILEEAPTEADEEETTGQAEKPVT